MQAQLARTGPSILGGGSSMYTCGLRGGVMYGEWMYVLRVPAAGVCYTSSGVPVTEEVGSPLSVNLILREKETF